MFCSDHGSAIGWGPSLSRIWTVADPGEPIEYPAPGWRVSRSVLTPSAARSSISVTSSVEVASPSAKVIGFSGVTKSVPALALPDAASETVRGPSVRSRVRVKLAGRPPFSQSSEGDAVMVTIAGGGPTMATLPVSVASAVAPAESVTRTVNTGDPASPAAGSPLAVPAEETPSHAGPLVFSQVKVSPMSGSPR